MCFSLPISVCNKIDSLCWDFFWGLKEDSGRHHPKSWDFICRQKYLVGWALEKPRRWIGHWWPSWGSRLCSIPITFGLISRKSGFKQQPARSISGFWKSTWAVRDLLNSRTYFKIGLQSNVRVWEDPQTPTLASLKPDSSIFSVGKPTWVGELIDENLKQWWLNLFYAIFSLLLVREILKIKFFSLRNVINWFGLPFWQGASIPNQLISWIITIDFSPLVAYRLLTGALFGKLIVIIGTKIFSRK